MTEFETQNTIDVVLDDRSLTEAKAELEDELSSVPIDVAVEASGGGGGAGGASSEWQEQHQLSRERNRLLEQIADGIDEGNFDRAARSGGGLIGGGAALLGAGAILGVGALSSVLSNFSWPSLPEFTWPEMPDLDPPPLPEPDWHPLNVVEPDPVPIEEPGEYPLEEPGEYPVGDPDPAEYPVEQPDPIQVERAEASRTSSEVSTESTSNDFQADQQASQRVGGTGDPTDSPQSSSTSAAEEGGSGVGLPEILLGGAAATAGAAGFTALRNIGSAGAGSAASGGAFMTPEGLGMTDFSDVNRRRRRANQFLDDAGAPDQFRLRQLDEENEHPGSVFSAEGRQAQAEGMGEIATRIENAIQNLAPEESTQRTDVSLEASVNVDGASRREVERAAEQAKEDALREFDRAIRSGGRGPR
ncbi:MULTISPECIES: hypothetical protein [Haloferacaceae]|uniref:Uncharacterized protein n=1 Tax=Halorubrum glutamatedens TaxID=2707018 RepID=A0ABD5QTQ4_9EURY|nr:hypothetical protein [Halobellus captivus]